MPSFSQRSLNNLASCTGGLQDVCIEAIKCIDFAVTCGHRTEEEQARLYAQGRTMPGRIITNARPGQSIHNTMPSRAFDFCPWPVDWEDVVRFGVVAGVLKHAAFRIGVDLEWGGDWDAIVDYPHIQQVRK